MVEKSMRAVDSWSQSFCDEAQTSWREKYSFAKWGTIPLIPPPKFVNAKWVPRYLFFQVMRGYKKRKMIKNCNCAITESETWFYAGIKFTQMAFLSNFRKGWKSVFSRIRRRWKLKSFFDRNGEGSLDISWNKTKSHTSFQYIILVSSKVCKEWAVKVCRLITASFCNSSSKVQVWNQDK